MPTIFTFKRSLEYFTQPLKEAFVFVYLVQCFVQMLLDATKLFNFNLSVFLFFVSRNRWGEKKDTNQ